MTIKFIGTVRYRFRLSLFGHDIFAGAWQTQNVNFEEPVPSESTSIAILDGFSASIAESSNGVSFGLEWEGIPLVSETVPLTGSLPVSVQPLKGVILTGTATVGA